MSEPARNCDGCTLCCKVFAIAALEKPQGVWCQHCQIGTGCGAYETRPTPCRTFFCGYLRNTSLSDAWKPSTAKFLLIFDDAAGHIAVHADTARADSWRREPYYAQLRQWAAQLAATNRQVTVRIGSRIVVILPDKDVELGQVGDDERVVTKWVSTPKGRRLEAYKWHKDDPRLATSAKTPGRPPKR